MTKFLFVFLFTLALLSPHSSASVEIDPIVVIVHSSNKVKDLRKSELARIFKGQDENWPGGRKIVIVNRPYDSKIRIRFYKTVLRAKPTQKFFKPGSPIPIKSMVAISALASRKFVERIPLAITYVYRSQLKLKRGQYKVIKIDGKNPDDPDYPIK